MSYTIMIVDDMKLNIELLSESLDDKYIIVPATSGEAAIKLLERKKPDLVLLDVFMPDINGFDVLKYMKGKNEYANIPVIFVTGEHDIFAEEKGLELGAVDYIKKPFNATIIDKKVQNHLDLKIYRDDLKSLVEQRTKELVERTEELENRTKQLDSSREAIIMGMSLMSDRHDESTGEHIERIKKCTGILTDKMLEMYPEMLDSGLAKQIILFSPLHDVGKVGISDTILKKPGALTPNEFETMKTHTLKGAEILRKTEQFLAGIKDGDNLKTAIEIAEYHHEKYDGSGYPHGLEGEDIPISARIVAVADVYDALRSIRPYKRSFSHEESLRKMIVGDEKTSGRHFDPKVLEAFKAVEEDIQKIY